MYRSFLLAFLLLGCTLVRAQENSPFSRYGLGDLYPQQSIPARGMGGVSAAYVEQSLLFPVPVNSANPASYGFIQRITFDVGISIDQRNLRSRTPALTYSSANFMPSYVILGVPLNSAKGWGVAFGVKPVSRINYSVQELVPNGNADTLQKLHQGNGGLTQGFIGIGKRWGKLDGTNFSLGLNFGYEFGRKTISNIINYIDSVPFVKSNYENTTAYSGVVFNPGFMIGIPFGRKTDRITNITTNYMLRFGASVTLQHELTGSQDNIIESFEYDANGAMIPIDTIKMDNDVPGKIKIPLTYTAGFMLSKMLSGIGSNKWSIGADYTAGKWSQYRFYGQSDQVIDNYMVHAGASYQPDLFSPNLFGRSIYRIGFYSGKNAINADGNGYKENAVTFGLGFVLKKYRGQYDNQTSLINTAFEIGKRGSNVNNVTENYFKLSVGLSLSDLWFIKRKYD